LFSIFKRIRLTAGTFVLFEARNVIKVTVMAQKPHKVYSWQRFGQRKSRQLTLLPAIKLSI